MSDNHDLLNDNEMCSFSGHEAEDMCFDYGDYTYRNNRGFVTNKVRYLLGCRDIYMLNKIELPLTELKICCKVYNLINGIL